MKYKIAYCIPSLENSGGMERVLTIKANYLVDILNYDVYIIVTEDYSKQPFYKLSKNVHLINLKVNFGDLWNYSFIKRVPIFIKKQRIYKKRLTKALMTIKPDITDTLMRREINFINDINDGSIKIGEIHNNKYHYRNFEKNDINLAKKIFAKYWMWSFHNKIKHLKRFIVLSSEDKENWSGLKNIIVINNPISFQTEKIAKLDNKKVIAVGRYTYQKGFDILIQAWKLVVNRHPYWSLNIYGNGNSQPYMILCKELGLTESCHLKKETNDIINKYLESSIFVLSSRFEGFPMVLPEAMSVGLPCVAFTCPCGTKDIINDGEDGLWVDNGNVKMLADKICYLIENETKRKKMGLNALNNIKRLNLKSIMEQWDSLFNELIKKNDI